MRATKVGNSTVADLRKQVRCRTRTDRGRRDNFGRGFTLALRNASARSSTLAPERPRSSSMTTICSRPHRIARPDRRARIAAGSIPGGAQPAEPWMADVHNRQTVLVASKDLVADQAAAAPDKARLLHPAPPRQPRPRASDAGPFVPTQSQCCPCVRGAASSKSPPADRSSRDPSQRANADSVGNPILGDSPRSVNLSAAVSMGYREYFRGTEETMGLGRLRHAGSRALAMRDKPLSESPACTPARLPPPRRFGPSPSSFVAWLKLRSAASMAGNPLASLPSLPQRPSLARSSASETRLTQPGIQGARSRKLNSAPTAAFRFTPFTPAALEDGATTTRRRNRLDHSGLPLSARHFQMELDRTSRVLLHHAELARHAPRQPIYVVIALIANTTTKKGLFDQLRP